MEPGLTEHHSDPLLFAPHNLAVSVGMIRGYDKREMLRNAERTSYL